MILRCIRPFGNFDPGDEVEAPDGAEFDHFYFESDAPSAGSPSTAEALSGLEAGSVHPPQESE